jgi:hypothetical protein
MNAIKGHDNRFAGELEANQPTLENLVTKIRAGKISYVQKPEDLIRYFEDDRLFEAEMPDLFYLAYTEPEWALMV